MIRNPSWAYIHARGKTPPKEGKSALAVLSVFTHITTIIWQQGQPKQQLDLSKQEQLGDKNSNNMQIHILEPLTLHEPTVKEEQMQFNFLPPNTNLEDLHTTITQAKTNNKSTTLHPWTIIRNWSTIVQVANLT